MSEESALVGKRASNLIGALGEIIAWDDRSIPLFLCCKGALKALEASINY
jgi:hypothetical protein